MNSTWHRCPCKSSIHDNQLLAGTSRVMKNNPCHRSSYRDYVLGRRICRDKDFALAIITCDIKIRHINFLFLDGQHEAPSLNNNLTTITKHHYPPPELEAHSHRQCRLNSFHEIQAPK